MVVPQTPLFTSRVLTEDKELWDDVKVRHWRSGGFFIWPQGGSKDTDLQPRKCLDLSSGGNDQRPGHHACRLWPGEDQRPGHVQQPFA